MYQDYVNKLIQFVSETQTVNKCSTNISSMNWLKQKREQVGINSQEELAARLQLEGINVTRAAISHWENGRNRPAFDDPDFTQALARVLRLTPPELLKLAGYQVARTNHTDAGERGAAIIDSLPPDRQNLAIKLLEQLLTE